MTKYWLVLITMATGFVLAGCGDSDFGKSDPGQAQVDKAQQYDADAAVGWDGATVPKGSKLKSDFNAWAKRHGRIAEGRF